MAQVLATGERVAAVQIGVIRLRACVDMPTAQRLALAEQCTLQLDETVPRVHQVRTWIQVANLLRDSR